MTGWKAEARFGAVRAVLLWTQALCDVPQCCLAICMVRQITEHKVTMIFQNAGKNYHVDTASRPRRLASYLFPVISNFSRIFIVLFLLDLKPSYVPYNVVDTVSCCESGACDVSCV
jgi:hypothetical protein